jgi:hypothetical protein
MEYLFDLKKGKRFNGLSEILYETLFFYVALVLKNILIALGNDFYLQLRILLYK